MDGWRDEWMEEWVDGWMDKCRMRHSTSMENQGSFMLKWWQNPVLWIRASSHHLPFLLSLLLRWVWGWFNPHSRLTPLIRCILPGWGGSIWQGQWPSQYLYNPAHFRRALQAPCSKEREGAVLGGRPPSDLVFSPPETCTLHTHTHQVSSQILGKILFPIPNQIISPWAHSWCSWAFPSLLNSIWFSFSYQRLQKRLPKVC